MVDFDPSGVGIKGSLFGFPYQPEDADLIIIPMPWDVTVSYGAGTALGPKAILDASVQLDFELYGVERPWSYPVAMVENLLFEKDNIQSRQLAEAIIDELEQDKPVDSNQLRMVNQACQEMFLHGHDLASTWLDRGKKVAFLGGDHSTPLGLIKALSDQQSFGILQIDAHMDLRQAYEGFEFSHASIMYNAIRLERIQSITQVGIRDYCEEEVNFIKQSENPIHVFYDDQVKAGMMQGHSWHDWVEQIIATLPDRVYISFDIDGLQPFLCPNAGTPVPGGLTFEEADYLLRAVARSGKEIIGFDLSEVGPGENEWDANVGARILYRLCTYLGLSSGQLNWD
ncbi:MAG: agmatinase family protein [Cytophagales bacterium]|nr:agmatinase family protein [Cytophagales bacterium]